jgi:hypothetical protein
MALSPEGAEMTKTNGKTGWSRFRTAQLTAALLISTGVLSAAAAVAAARAPDPMVAYGPPAPISVSVAPIESDATDSSMTPPFVSADPSIGVAEVPAIGAEVVSAPATVETVAEASVVEAPTSVETPEVPTATSSVVESPELVASSWSMDPLPEGEGGTVGSSTSVDPVTPTSSVVASPQ